MNKTVLVTGGSGFIGSYLCEKLISKHYNVICFDNLSTGGKNNIASLIGCSNFKFVKGDVRNIKEVSKAMSDADVIYHLAAVVGVQNVINNPLEDLEVNFQGTKNVVETAFKQGKKKIIFTSSSEVYGKNSQIPLSEDKSDGIFGPTIYPRWAYGHSKALSEHLIIAYGKQGLPFTIIRYFNCYGPRGINNHYVNVIPLFIQKAIENNDIPIYNSGKQTRAFCYVDDTVEGTVKAGEKINKDIVNIGGNDEVSINELAQKIIKLTGSKSKVKHIDPQIIYKNIFDDSEKRVPDISKAKKLINWHTQIDLDEGLKRTFDWTIKNRGRNE